MCDPSASHENVPEHGPLVTSPTSSDFDLTIHGSCARCHHYINKEVVQLPRNLQGQGADVICSNCGNRIMKLGRASTHSSFASQETTLPPVERTDSYWTGEAHGGPAFTRNIRHSSTLSTWAPSDHIPGTVPEVAPASPHDGDSARSSSFLEDGDLDAASTAEGHGQHPRDNLAQVDIAPTTTSTRPPSTIRPATRPTTAVDAQETLRPVNLQNNDHSPPKRPGLLSRFRLRSRAHSLINSVNQRASHRLSRLRTLVIRLRPSPPRSPSPSKLEHPSLCHSQDSEHPANGEAEHGVGSDNRQQAMEDPRLPGPDDVDGPHTDTDGAPLNSEQQSGDASALRAAKGRELAEKRRQLTIEANVCKCGCVCPCRHFAIVSHDIDRVLQDGSTISSTPCTVGRGRSTSRHSALRRLTNRSTENFLQRGNRLSGVTVATSTEAASSGGTRTENDAIADENDSTRALGHGGHYHP